MNDKITIGNKTYQSEPESYECEGCAASGNIDLCGQLPKCNDVVFIEVEETK